MKALSPYKVIFKPFTTVEKITILRIGIFSLRPTGSKLVIGRLSNKK